MRTPIAILGLICAPGWLLAGLSVLPELCCCIRLFFLVIIFFIAIIIIIIIITTTIIDFVVVVKILSLTRECVCAGRRR